MPRRPSLARVTREWAEVQQQRVDPGGSVLILIELAVATAMLADKAKQGDDQQGFLSAASRLQQLIMVVERDGRGRRDADAESGGDGAAADGRAGELAAVLRAGPSLGDAA